MLKSPALKLSVLRPVLLAAALLPAAFLAAGQAAPNTGGGGGQTKQVCEWVQVPVMVSDGHDRYGFPINLRIEYQWHYFCKTVPA